METGQAAQKILLEASCHCLKRSGLILTMNEPKYFRKSALKGKGYLHLPQTEALLFESKYCKMVQFRGGSGRGLGEGGAPAEPRREEVVGLAEG